MPTAVESYGKLGAVVVHLPAPAATIEVVQSTDLNNSAHIGGRSGLAASRGHQQHSHVGAGSPTHIIATNTDNQAIPGRSALGPISMFHPHQNPAAGHTVHPLSHHAAAHHPAPAHVHPTPAVHPVHVVNTGDYQPIGGRTGVGPVSMLQPHQDPAGSHVAHPLSHTTATHHPAPVHVHPTTTIHPVHVVNTGDYQPIPGRSGIGALRFLHQGQSVPAVQDVHQAANRTASTTQPTAAQDARLNGILRGSIHAITDALQKTVTQGQMLEVIGFGTDAETLGVLIGLLKTQGYHVTIASCDGSVRPGFPLHTAVLRCQGGAVAGQFLQELAAARGGHKMSNSQSLPTR